LAGNRLSVLAEIGAFDETTAKKIEISDAHGSILGVVRVAEVSTVVCVCVVLIGVRRFRAVVDHVSDSIEVQVGIGISKYGCSPQQ
jgi:hypothetical protein